MKKTIRGFTIIELLIVIVVIAILAAIVLVSYNGVQARARDDRRKTDILSITKALELYYNDNGSYPAPSGTSSVINPWWYSSGDSSWNTFKTALVGTIDVVPSDPINSPGSPLSAGNYGYAYFSAGGYCGKAAGQWYLLVYRYEIMTKERFSDGDCTTPILLGDGYFDGGNSYYRSVK